jgi:hypothetical protein
MTLLLKAMARAGSGDYFFINFPILCFPLLTCGDYKHTMSM